MHQFGYTSCNAYWFDMLCVHKWGKKTDALPYIEWYVVEVEDGVFGSISNKHLRLSLKACVAQLVFECQLLTIKIINNQQNNTALPFVVLLAFLNSILHTSPTQISDIFKLNKAS